MTHSMPGLPVHHQLPESTQTHVHWVGDAIQPSHLLLSPSPPVLNLSQHQGLFQWVSSLHQVAKGLELQLQHQSLHEHPGLISFRMDWLALFAVQGTLKSLLQHHSSKASILQCSAFFIVQFSHPYMTTGKTIALTRSPGSGNCSWLTNAPPHWCLPHLQVNGSLSLVLKWLKCLCTSFSSWSKTPFVMAEWTNIEPARISG